MNACLHRHWAHVHMQQFELHIEAWTPGPATLLQRLLCMKNWSSVLRVWLKDDNKIDHEASPVRGPTFFFGVNPGQTLLEL